MDVLHSLRSHLLRQMDGLPLVVSNLTSHKVITNPKLLFCQRFFLINSSTDNSGSDNFN